MFLFLTMFFHQFPFSSLFSIFFTVVLIVSHDVSQYFMVFMIVNLFIIFASCFIIPLS